MNQLGENPGQQGVSVKQNTSTQFLQFLSLLRGLDLFCIANHGKGYYEHSNYKQLSANAETMSMKRDENRKNEH